MPRDPFVHPLHEDDPTNLPLGTGAVYEDFTEPNWTPLAAGFNIWEIDGPGIGLQSASDPVRKVFYYNGAAWVQYTTVRIADSFSWSQKPWVGPAENPSYAADNIFLLFAEDKETYLEANMFLRYSDYLGHGGTPISGAVNQDLVWVRQYNTYGAWYTGIPAKGYCWSTIDPNIPKIGAQAGTKVNLVRIGELVADYGIDHALFMAVGQNLVNKNVPWAPVGTKSYVWPNGRADAGLYNPNYKGTGNLYLGSRIALPTSLDLTTFAAAQAAISGLETTQGLETARAMQDYGAYCVETTSDSAAVIYGERYIVNTNLGGWTSATYAAWKRDVKRILAACKIISNNHANGNAPPGNIPGGSTGTLRKAKAEAFGVPAIPAAPTSAAIIHVTSDSFVTQADAAEVIGETGFEVEHRKLPAAFTGTPQITDIPADPVGVVVKRLVGNLTPGNYEARWRSKGQGADRSAWSAAGAGTIPAAVIGRAILASGRSTVAAASHQTEAFATTGKAGLYAIQARTTDGSVPISPTLNKAGLSFTAVASIGLSTYRKLFLFWAAGVTSSSDLTIDFGSQQVTCTWSVEEITDLDTAAPIVQVKTGSIN